MGGHGLGLWSKKPAFQTEVKVSISLEVLFFREIDVWTVLERMPLNVCRHMLVLRGVAHLNACLIF